MALPPVITTKGAGMALPLTTLESLEGMGDDIETARAVLTSSLNDAAELTRKAFAEGHTVSEIARAAGVTRPTVYQWLKEEQK